MSENKKNMDSVETQVRKQQQNAKMLNWVR